MEHTDLLLYKLNKYQKKLEHYPNIVIYQRKYAYYNDLIGGELHSKNKKTYIFNKKIENDVYIITLNLYMNDDNLTKFNNLDDNIQLTAIKIKNYIKNNKELTEYKNIKFKINTNFKTLYIRRLILNLIFNININKNKKRNIIDYEIPDKDPNTYNKIISIELRKNTDNKYELYIHFDNLYKIKIISVGGDNNPTKECIPELEITDFLNYTSFNDENNDENNVLHGYPMDLQSMKGKKCIYSPKIGEVADLIKKRDEFN